MSASAVTAVNVEVIVPGGARTHGAPDWLGPEPHAPVHSPLP